MSQLNYPNQMGQGGFGMAPPQPAPEQKQRYNVYTIMLVLSFFALVTACVLLHMELMQFGEADWWNTGNIRPVLPGSAALPSVQQFFVV